MKRFWLTLLCCSPLLFSPLISHGVVLTGPNGEQEASYGQYGPITEIETLWGISSTVKPSDSVSVQQTLVAIYKLNPSVFYQGNINRLIPGRFIQVPTLGFVQQQTAREAIALINKFSKSKKATVKPKPTPVVVKKQPIVIPAEKAPVIADNNALMELEKKLKGLREEYDALNEDFIRETERNQELKLRLQPLYDQVSELETQVNESLEKQVEMQQIIDDYRAQLDAVKERPFSGSGFFNKLLRTITGSLTNLLIALISPILLLLAVFALILRINSKRALQKQAEELADSTDISMEEPGKFDDLLTDDLTDELEVDFNEDEELVNTPNQPEEQTAISLEDEVEQAIDLSSDELEIDISSEDDDVSAIAILPDDENEDDLFSSTDLSESEDDDPFGIAALAEEEAPEQDEDDPFGISALIDDDSLDDDKDAVDNPDDPFGIGALVEEENLIPEEVIEHTEPISESEQADLDLAAEWERQLSGSEDDATNSTDTVDSEELAKPTTATDTPLAETEKTQQENIDDVLNDIDLDTVKEDDIDDIEFDLPEAVEPDVVEDATDDIEFDLPEAKEADVVEDATDDIEFDLPEAKEPDVVEDAADDIEFDLPEAKEADVVEDATDDIEFDLPEAKESDVVEDATDDIEFDLPEAKEQDVVEDATDAIEFDLPEAKEADVVEDATDGIEFDLPDEDNSKAIEDEIDEISFDNIDEADREDQSEPESIEDALDVIDLDELDLAELENAEPVNIEDALAELDLEEAQQSKIDDVADEPVKPEDAEIETALEDDPNDLLAKQLSDVAFKEDGPLPKVDKSTKNDFIDIETLLESSNGSSADEPYSEFDLDLGLDDFPDVINATDSNISDAENEISAQLDLARAYLEIDDKAGAKEILLAVQQDSQGAQKVEIEKLLSRIG
ncbi:FimV/HubP family polar landmark protein [Psychromonas sp. PT13]|uniref:FimV/HubP family polar landmark protein n=1 Tax=Psychromonas sp. PT13 TaxID=3439547 RepID=UPI003EBB327C